MAMGSDLKLEMYMRIILIQINLSECSITSPKATSSIGLKLGPSINGNAENFLEHAINTLNNATPDLPMNPSKQEIKISISKCQKELKRDKTRLADYVPYKILSPFFDDSGMEEGLAYIKNDKHSRLIAYMEKLSGNENIFYTILDGIGLQKKIRINAYWRKMILQNFVSSNV